MRSPLMSRPRYDARRYGGRMWFAGESGGWVAIRCAQRLAGVAGDLGYMQFWRPPIDDREVLLLFKSPRPMQTNDILLELQLARHDERRDHRHAANDQDLWYAACKSTSKHEALLRRVGRSISNRGHDYRRLELLRGLHTADRHPPQSLSPRGAARSLPETTVIAWRSAMR